MQSRPCPSNSIVHQRMDESREQHFEMISVQLKLYLLGLCLQHLTVHGADEVSLIPCACPHDSLNLS